VVRKGLIITHDGYAIPCWHYPWERSPEIDRCLHNRSLDEIVDSMEVIGELEHAIGPGGCIGCSTMCYNWDEEFRRKVMTPNGLRKFRQQWKLGKERLRLTHPGVISAYESIREKLPV